MPETKTEPRSYRPETPQIDGHGKTEREPLYPPATQEIGRRRRELAPEINDAFEGFSRAVFSPGALPEKTKQLIAVAVAHTTQCPYCIAGHSRLARRKGASDAEI